MGPTHLYNQGAAPYHNAATLHCRFALCCNLFCLLTAYERVMLLLMNCLFRFMCKNPKGIPLELLKVLAAINVILGSFFFTLSTCDAIAMDNDV